MPSPDSIDRLLSVAAALLDCAAGEIRDANLAPVREKIEKVGRALAEIAELRQSIYVHQPALAPHYLAHPQIDSDANKRLMRCMSTAYEHEQEGDFERARQTFSEYLARTLAP
jgi:nitrate reductase cytochrome c-type subunit